MADDRSFAFDVAGRARSLPRPAQVVVAVCVLGMLSGVGLALTAAGGNALGTAALSVAPADDLVLGAAGVSPRPVIVVQTPTQPEGERNPALPGAAAPEPPPSPMSIGIPAIGVSSHVIPLGLRPDGSLQTPSDFGVAGWWSGGPAPGAVGAAVIVGHVDSKAGPAVFFRLRDLKPGDMVWVTRGDGTRVSFVVRRLEQVSKAHFPSKEVYGPQPYAALRLITCGGAFDRSTGHYVDNIIVFADAA
jgi:sortase (surface protein transpeptidase)